MPLTREEIIEDLRNRYAAPWGGHDGSAALESMKLTQLRALHRRLVALAERPDLRRRPTPETQQRREVAKARLSAAVARLRSLKADEHAAAQTPIKRPAVETVVRRTVATKTLSRSDADLDALVHGMIDLGHRVDEQVFHLIATEFKENVALHLKEITGPANRDVDRLLDATPHLYLQTAIQTTFESSRLDYIQALNVRLYHVARGLKGSPRLLKTLNHWVHETERLRALEPLVLSEPDRVMPAHMAPETLRKLQAFVVTFRPDAFYVSGAGSRALAEFLALEIGVEQQGEAPIWQERQARPATLRKQAPRILFVSDIAEDAKAYDRFRTQIGAIRDATLGFAALVGSVDVRASLVGVADTYIAALAFEKGYDLPWSRRGQYRREQGVHVFGADTPNTLAIPDAFLRNPLAEIEPVGELP